ncbi:MAG: 4'-phosphopantetheinyl transferase superfamily protein [Oscillospiraceae bacterium]|nr:4'-phosphopantetheinyl transferase superfamily protein [Oscillospiraceae bacterium]
MDIILLRIKEDLTWAEISGFMGCLDTARRAAVNKKANDTDKINALLSRLLIISEIKRRMGFSERKIRFEFGSFGKPYLKNSTLQFSLSHTRGAVCAAFCEGEEIGVDVERRSRRVSEAMYRRVLSVEERSRAANDEDFMRFWVKKEAFLKRIGVGITRDLRGVNSLELPDTAVIDCGDLFVGASGKGALDAGVDEITFDKLLNRFTLKL